MTINKYNGKTEEEAKAKAREALGQACVIMNIKEIKPKGLGGIFKSSTYEVTAAVEDDNTREDAMMLTKKPVSSTFEVVAGKEEDDAILLKEAFSAVTEVLEKQKDAVAQAQITLEPVKEEPAPKVSVEVVESFEPLSGSAKRAHLVEPIYSKPKNAPVFQSVTPSRPKADIPVEEKPVPKPAPKPAPKPVNIKPSIDNDNHMFVKMLYNVLLDNEVQEKYINSVLEDMDKVLQTSHSLDNLLSSVYQKMVLKLGTPQTIVPGERRPKVIFFIGPTGVGKTTTIAKLASKFKVEEGKRVGLITADTYRMAAANQLQTYANILGVPLNVIYSSEELLDTVKKQARENDDLDVILVDTTGFSHKNEQQRADTCKLINSLGDYYDNEVYLVLSATTKYKDLVDITDTYLDFTKFNLVFTKIDETKTIGNIFNLKLYTGAPLSYITCGQNVPDDIETVNAQKLVKQLLGGN